ncbi:TlpA family protein disulfide reductase [Pseudobythopirellula maris]|nr:TlpA disulfide reductase family protein [Pseudobythopirellula maris]
MGDADTPAPPEQKSPAPAKRSFHPLLWLVAAVVVGMLIEGFTRPAGEAHTPAPLPPLLVEGWVNTGPGATPSRESLAGRLVVIDAWATWCPPCVASLPQMAKLREEFSTDDVAFLGLTSEPGSQLDRVEAMIERIDGFDWPVGYGAKTTWEAMGVYQIPTLVLYDRTGVSVWRGHSTADLRRELRARSEGAAGGGTL